MSKWDEQILVINRKDLFNNEENHFYGFLPREDEKVKKIVDTRNYYTHFDESKKDLIMTTEELIYISKYILVILKVLIMKELGLDEAFIELQLKGLSEIIFTKAKLKKLFNIKSLQ